MPKTPVAAHPTEAASQPLPFEFLELAANRTLLRMFAADLQSAMGGTLALLVSGRHQATRLLQGHIALPLPPVREL